MEKSKPKVKYTKQKPAEYVCEGVCVCEGVLNTLFAWAIEVARGGRVGGGVAEAGGR